ncbi:unnamed protein product [Lactuca virosa]|uniref:No apical meristem-associated C-terminal domain-containing protein n=1 Tax=Lactuca virosa TaxID=75947 RepID=A0AAU9P3A9_9ASTR|nr:unnamed protein product [Lactuca virosa]
MTEGKREREWGKWVGMWTEEIPQTTTEFSKEHPPRKNITIITNPRGNRKIYPTLNPTSHPDPIAEAKTVAAGAAKGRETAGPERSHDGNTATTRMTIGRIPILTLSRNRSRSREVRNILQRMKPKVRRRGGGGKRKERKKREEKEKRRRREKEKKKRRKERDEDKSKKKKKKKDKKKEKVKKGAVTDSWGKYGIIRETDMWNKRPEFTAWLAEVKQANLESLPTWEEKQMFKQFMEDHNTATFPHKKYYSLDAYHRRKIEKAIKKGSTKATKSERVVFDDEEQRRLELQREREKQKEAEVEALKRSMQSGMAQAMKEQAILREEMNYLFKIGNVEAASAIQRRLDPDLPM